jgi:hypothetical protein
VLKDAGYGTDEVQSLVESRAAKGLDAAQTKQEQFLA